MVNPCMHVLHVYLLPHAPPSDANLRMFLRVTLEPPSSSLLQGALICIGSLGLLVTSNQLADKDWDSVDKGKGDAFMILSATPYSFSTS